MRGAAAGPVQELRERAVGLHVARQHAPPARALAHEGGPRTVTEQHGGGAVGPVHDGRELLRGDDEHLLCLLGRDESFRDIERVQEAGARGLNIEGGGVLGAEQRLQVTRLRGEQPVGRAGRHHESIDIGRREAGLLEHLLRRGLAHAGVGLVGPGHPALADAGALPDPLIRRVEDLRELVVGHHALGRVPTGSDELGDGTLHRAAPAPPPASSAPMSWSTCVSTMWAAARTALMMARAGEEP